jgi:hypothetical protein
MRELTNEGIGVEVNGYKCGDFNKNVEKKFVMELLKMDILYDFEDTC